MDENEMIDAIEMELFETGAMYLDGVDEDGEILVKFNMDILKEVSPDLYRWWQDEIDTALLDLSAKGLVELDFTDPENVVVNLTDLGREVKGIINE